MKRFAGTTTVLVSVIALAAAGSVARGQEEDDFETAEEQERRAEAEAPSIERARAAAWCFLTQGPGAPRPDVTWAQVQSGKTRVDIGHVRTGGPERYLHVDDHYMHVAADGTVVYYDDMRQCVDMVGLRPDKTLRTEEEIEAEVTERTRFDEEACRARATAFLRSRYPDYEQRKFEEYSCSRRELMWDFVWSEVEPPGVLKIYRNRLQVWVNAETGEVRLYAVTNYRRVVRTAPPVTEAMARELGEKDGRPILDVYLLVDFQGERGPFPMWRVRFERNRDAGSCLDVDAFDATARYTEEGD